MVVTEQQLDERIAEAQCQWLLEFLSIHHFGMYCQCVHVPGDDVRAEKSENKVFSIEMIHENFTRSLYDSFNTLLDVVSDGGSLFGTCMSTL